MPEQPERDSALLTLRGLVKSYGTTVVTDVLRGIDLQIQTGEFTAIIGPSGSGKSTLLNQMGLLDRPTRGSVLVHGLATEQLSESELTALRSRTLGFIFQFHHLIGAFSALHNLVLPLAIQERRITKAQRERARLMLERVGLSDMSERRPEELSGGQQQRVAIARALVHEPEIVLADEPTGNLDSQTAGEVFSLLRDLNQEQNITFLIVTHDPRMARLCDRVIRIEDGSITGDGRPDEVLGADGPDM